MGVTERVGITVQVQGGRGGGSSSSVGTCADVLDKSIERPR